jgi:hypothetical protein
MGRGEAPLDVNGDGVAPRDRAVCRSDGRLEDSADDGRVILLFSSSSSLNETKRRVRDRIAEFDREVVFVEAPGLRLSRRPLLELIPVDGSVGVIVG